MAIADITRSIMSAWDDDKAQEETQEGAEGEQEESAETDTTTEGEDEALEEGGEPEESAAEEEEVTPDEEEDEDEPEEEEAEEEVGAFHSDDPEVNAFLAKYQGDIEKALKAEAQQQRAIGQQGQELSVLRRRVSELETELQQATAFNQDNFLTEEQQGWVESALESGNPRGYVQSAVSAGEFDLARAVCARWAEESPYEALRASQQIDQLEQHAYAANEPVDAGIPYNDLVGILVQHFPDMPQYEEKMVSTLSALGEQHPLVQDARSQDAEVQARGIIGIYEIARAQTASVQGTKSKLKQQRRQDADNARAAAVVSSAQATPSPGETPRPRHLTPGLTLEQLDAEFARK